MGNTYLDRVAARGSGGAGRASERRLAKSLGGKLRPGSGAIAGAKGDVVYADYLIEAKSTQAATMGLQFDWLLKINHEALGIGRIPALSLRFVTPTGAVKPNGSWVCIPEWHYQELSHKAGGSE